MIFITRPQTSPLFNIAAEEYVLKYFDEDVLMLWQSAPSVVVGKHQNLVAEVNLGYVRREGIPVIRRVSGGGTVFHDFGNLNYTLIRTEENRERLIDFKRFSTPVMEFLKIKGLSPKFEGKNNLVINGKKFSGNSAHVFKNRVMHHGTLLFNTDLDKLDMVIRPSEAQIADKSVKSVRATVLNLSEVLPGFTFSRFRDELTAFMKKYHDIKTVYDFSEKDIAAINKLVNDKYGTVQWNYGYSPAYEFRNSVEGHRLCLKVKNGIIEEIEIESPDLNFTDGFTGVLHRFEEVGEVIGKLVQDKVRLQLLLKLFGF